jgi:hypothetical protein
MKASFILFMLSFSSFAKLQPVDYDRRICHVIQSNWGWARALKRVSKDYDISPGLLLSVIYHESGFRPNVRPKPYMVFGVIPWQVSSAYGYGQIKQETWDWYKSHNPGWFQSRTQFPDTLNFIGWYYSLFLKKTETKTVHRDFYLAYHEGLGGYQRGTYHGNDWLIKKAESVALRAKLYDEKLNDCLR